MTYTGELFLHGRVVVTRATIRYRCEHSFYEGLKSLLGAGCVLKDALPPSPDFSPS